MDENGFSREVIRRSSRHLTWAGSGVSSTSATAPCHHRVIHLKRQKRTGCRWDVDLATGRGREDFKYVYSFPEGKLDRMHRGTWTQGARAAAQEVVQDTGQTEYRHEVQEAHQAAVGALGDWEAARPAPPGEDLSTDKEGTPRESSRPGS